MAACAPDQLGPAMLAVICYDIANNKRRTKLAKLLLSYGHRVQESVFHCRLANDRDLDKLADLIEKLIDARQDNCHIYRLCARCDEEYRTLGTDWEEEKAPVIVC